MGLTPEQVLQRESRIEWFDSEHYLLTRPTKQLESEGHKVNIAMTLYADTIQKLREEKVDLIITEILLDAHGLPPYSTPAFGEYRSTPAFGEYRVPPGQMHPSMGVMSGLTLLESLCWSYNANLYTPKLVWTFMDDKVVKRRAEILVGEGNYLLKTGDNEDQFLDRVRALLPRK